MLQISDRMFAALTMDALWERTRKLLTDNSGSFARLPKAEQDVWLAAATEDFVESGLESEDALPTLLYVLWFQGLSSVMDDPEIRAILRDRRQDEPERLETVCAKVQTRLEVAAMMARR